MNFMWTFYDGMWLFGWTLKVLSRENSSLSLLLATLNYLHFPRWLPHFFIMASFACHPPFGPRHTILCTSVCFSGFFWNIPDPSIWALMSPLVLLWKPALSPDMLKCEWVFWLVLLSRPLEDRNAVCGVITHPTQVLEEAALSLECGGSREGKDCWSVSSADKILSV